MSKLKVLELFGGIGACSKALERLKIPFEIVDYVDNDKFAVRSFNAIHDSNFEVQDITQWDKQIDVDLIMHGSPCQDFSLAGKQAGGDKGSGTRSSLMYETIRIVKKLKPKYVIWENVKNLLSKKHRHNFDSYLEIMEQLGYKNYYQVLNAKDYGIPQNRERVFTISIRNDIKKEFKFPKEQELKLKLIDMLEKNVDEKYYLSEKNISYTINTKNDRRLGDTNYILEDYDELSCKDFLKIRNATKKGYLEAFEGDSVNLAYPDSKTRRGRVGEQVSQTLQCNDSMGVVNNDLRIRKLTPKECWRLMGFDDEDFEKAKQFNSDTQLYKQAGNSIVVNCLYYILKNLLEEGSDSNE